MINILYGQVSDRKVSPFYQLAVSFKGIIIVFFSPIEDDPPEYVQPVEPFETTYEIIAKGTQRGKPLLVDSVGYSYTVKVCISLF